MSVTLRIRKCGVAPVRLKAEKLAGICQEVAFPKGRHSALCLSKHNCRVTSIKQCFLAIIFKIHEDRRVKIN